MTDKIRLIRIVAVVTAFLALSAGSVRAGTITVGPGGGYDFSVIQPAINAAQAGDEVVIAPGTYTGAANKWLDFGGKAITVRSTDPNDPNIVAATVIDCQGNGPGFCLWSNETSSSVVAGLTVTNGYDLEGGGIYCWQSSPTIRNCDFINNYAYYYYNFGGGGGMYCSESSPTLVNCTFSKNSTPRLGGGMYLERGSTPTLINCTFRNNSVTSEGGIGGGGIEIGEGSSPTLINCTFSGNTVNGGDGGGMRISADTAYTPRNPTLINCIFNNNIAKNGNGGAIYCDDSQIWGYSSASSASLIGCILWGNSTQQLYGAVSVTYSDIQGGWEGAGNIDADPCFVDAGYWDQNGTPGDANDDFWVDGDYHLRPTSPCINAGDPNFVCEPSDTDMDGEYRIMGPRVDMGVDEYPGNIRPVADAGPDQSMSDIPPQVTLDGNDSSDADSDPLSYHWSQIFGPEVNIVDVNSAITTFSPAQYGAYIFELVVNDGSLESFPDTVNIVVGSGHVPVADAGLPRYAGTNPVQLDGAGSYDPDASGVLSYQWQQISGPAVNITDGNTATPTISGFTLTDSLQICEFELIVSDGQYSSLPDTVNVVVVRDGYKTCPFRLESDSFDPERPTIIFFRRSEFGDVPTWESKANIMSATVDFIGLQTDCRYGGDFIITYLSKVAPNYRYPIQFVGCSGGVFTEMVTATYLNRTYADPRYAINRVTFCDYGCYWPVIAEFLDNPVGGEQCWIDLYIDAIDPYSSPTRNFLNVTMLGFEHCDSLAWYRNSLTGDPSQFDSPFAGPGVVAGAYWSVIGPGKNLQLAYTPDAYTYEFEWHGSETSGYMVLDPNCTICGSLPEPVTLMVGGPTTGPNSAPGYLTCQESENAVGYQLLFGSDPYRVADYIVVSDTPAPPNQVITTLPFEKTYWTIKARDQYGSTIYADPLYVDSFILTRPIENLSTGKRYGYIQH
ncbi:MAG TPA: right-handed parallel beta-helix repeat-containing protein, partial [Sedimentisphaerales bacterium]|nr:right-handed parallel beta-helix repeat-containing protein [Sedimentisphaerales bacterium]